MCLVVVDGWVLHQLNVSLRLHAARRDDVDNVGNEIDALGRLLEFGNENGKNAADACQNLHKAALEKIKQRPDKRIGIERNTQTHTRNEI